MMEPLYQEGASRLHRLPAWLKLGGLVAAGSLLFLAHRLDVLGAACLAAVLLLAATGVGLATVWRHVRGMVLILAVLAVFTTYFNGYAAALEMVLRVVDAAGHPVAGASVALYQAVTGWQPPCTTCRCAAAPMYGKATASVMSDDDGMVTVTPLQYANTAAVTKITASAGTQGSITVTLKKAP